jgi:putative endonuclease
MPLSHLYILSNSSRTALYISVTSDLHTTIYRHKIASQSGRRQKAILVHLLYFEGYADIQFAIDRKKQLWRLKKNRKWALIMLANPKLEELASLEMGKYEAAP